MYAEDRKDYVWENAKCIYTLEMERIRFNIKEISPATLDLKRPYVKNN